MNCAQIEHCQGVRILSEVKPQRENQRMSMRNRREREREKREQREERAERVCVERRETESERERESGEKRKKRARGQARRVSAGVLVSKRSSIRAPRLPFYTVEPSEQAHTCKHQPQSADPASIGRTTGIDTALCMSDLPSETDKRDRQIRQLCSPVNIRVLPQQERAAARRCNDETWQHTSHSSVHASGGQQHIQADG